MKFTKRKIYVLTGILCLSPILLGLALWEHLPETMAIHFDIYGEADNFASKAFVVFGLPMLMTALQFFCLVAGEWNMKKQGEQKKFEKVMQWVIPIITVILQIVTLGYGLGWQLDIRRIVVFLVGILFLVAGNYMPKLDYVKNKKMSKDQARKVNRFMGYVTVILGVMFLVSLFFSPVVSAACLIFMAPYMIVCAIYGMRIARK